MGYKKSFIVTFLLGNERLLLTFHPKVKAKNRRFYPKVKAKPQIFPYF